ncbi:MAG: hypothetical protein Q8M76_02760 [Spirochaetaceae bacterium]|nr:hypothetical protein [Spirochaetaceae bacterium]
MTERITVSRLTAVAILALAIAPLAAQTKAPAAPSRSFRGLALGMSRDAAIEVLKADPYFAYRGPEDVSLLPSPNQSLIEATGLSFVKRAFFQFIEGTLWVMILDLNPAMVDHYSIYVSLTAKYGEPASIDPKEARWEDEGTRMSLERPLTLRYMDMTAYSKLREGSRAKESAKEIDRLEFLGDL